MTLDLRKIEAKLNWAAAEIKIFSEGCNEKSSNAKFVINRKDCQDGATEFSVYFEENVPDEINIRAGNIVHQLRASLDHIAVSLAIHNGANDTRDVYFPVCSTKEAFYKSKNKISKLSQNHQDLIESFQPYNGWESLADLHEANLIEKHNSELPRLGWLSGPFFDGEITRCTSNGAQFIRNKDQEVVFLRLWPSPNLKIGYNVGISFGILKTDRFMLAADLLNKSHSHITRLIQELK